MMMKRAIFGMIALTIIMLFTSCKEDVTPDDDNNANLKSTVSFKVNGAPYSFSREGDDGNALYPSITLTNDLADGGLLAVVFSDAPGRSFGFSGAYLANSSQEYKEGFMDYTDPKLEHYYYSESDDQCDSDSFVFQIRKQSAAIDHMPHLYRFTGTFSGRLAYYHGSAFNEPRDPCANPEFLEITDGKFSVIGLNDYSKSQ